MRRNSCILTAVVLAACCSGAAMAQSAVGNPGFEDATLGQAPPTIGNWASFFGGAPILDASLSTVAPHSGLSALHLQATGPSNAFVGVQQPVTGITPGASYTMKIWARSAGNINNPVEYRMEWQDANGTFIGNQFALTTAIDGALTSSYQQFTLTAVAPLGAVRANLVIDIQTYGFNPVNPMFDTEVFIDDVEFVQTPGQNACCSADGSCTVASVGACPSGTTPLALNSTCTVNNCPQPAPPAACCSGTTGACLMLVPSTCTGFGGTPGAANSTCSPSPCQATQACRADFNGNHLLEVQDIFDFLAAWFAGCP
jgi:hypothetical protein